MRQRENLHQEWCIVEAGVLVGLGSWHLVRAGALGSRPLVDSDAGKLREREPVAAGER
jgi:hypothetical protein